MVIITSNLFVQPYVKEEEKCGPKCTEYIS